MFKHPLPNLSSVANFFDPIRIVASDLKENTLFAAGQFFRLLTAGKFALRCGRSAGVHGIHDVLGLGRICPGGVFDLFGGIRTGCTCDGCCGEGKKRGCGDDSCANNSHNILRCFCQRTCWRSDMKGEHARMSEQLVFAHISMSAYYGT